MIKNIKPRCPVDIGDYFYHNNYFYNCLINL